MRRVAVLSLHTSPLAQPGIGDGGGMNVYVRELVSALAHAGVDCTTYTRAWRDDLPAEINVEPNHKVVHIPAGAVDMPKGDLLSVVPEFTDGVLIPLLGVGNGRSGFLATHERAINRQQALLLLGRETLIIVDGFRNAACLGWCPIQNSSAHIQSLCGNL